MDRSSSCFKAARGLLCSCPLCTGDSLVLLDTPDERMHGGHDCFDAACRCALGALNVRMPVRQACEVDGTDPRVAESFLRRAGLNVLSGQMTPADLKHHADQLRPVLLLVHWPGEACSHWIVSRGVSRRRIYLHDPWGGRRDVSEAELLVAWKADDARTSRPLKCWGIAAWVP